MNTRQIARKVFLDTVSLAVKDLIAKGRKINGPVAIAQAILESGHGESRLTKLANNVFGIKAGKSWKGKIVAMETREFDSEKKPFTSVCKFRSYETIEDCMADYSEVIEGRKWFKDAARDHTVSRLYLKGIMPGVGAEYGWATDPKYDVKILSIIEENKLDKIDFSYPKDGK